VLLSYLILVIGRLADAVSFVKYISAYYYYGFAILQGVWWGGVAGTSGRGGRDNSAGDFGP